MERAKREPLKIDDPMEFMRGYWKVTWRVINVPNFPPRVLVLRFSANSGKLGLASVTWGAAAGSRVSKIAEQDLDFEQEAFSDSLWISRAARRQMEHGANYWYGVGFFRGKYHGRPPGAPSLVIDLSFLTARDAVKGGFVEESGGWRLIGELEFERILEDKLVEVLKSLN